MTAAANDALWTSVAGFIREHRARGERVIGPRPLGELLPDTVPSAASRTALPGDFTWVVVHKGMLEAYDRSFLRGVLANLAPVFGNEVFVVYGNRADVPSLSCDEPHLRALLDAVEALPSTSAPAPDRSCPHRVLSGPREMAAVSRQELERASRLAWQFAPLGQATALCRVLTRYLMYVDTRDTGLAPHLCLNGCWEAWITQAIAGCLEPGQRCVDLGANHGYYTVLMADAVGPAGRVLAVEPNPGLAALLRQTLQVNGLADHVEVAEVAATDRSAGTAALRIPVRSSINASLHMSAPVDGDESAVETREVRTATVDELTAEWERVDLVKVDVEGSEESVWRGMRDTLTRNPALTVVAEFSTRRHYDPRAFLASIESEGFRLRYVDGDSRVKGLTADRCLTEATEWMLWLRRD